ncbi:MAG: gluconokinase [Chitinophagales bacterium]|nr:gluconokinase [Chitinophagales bacterium]
MQRPDTATVLYVMGVSGSGKSTIGRAVAEKLEWPFYDGDDFHPLENIDKMASGQPLNDEDRQGWLEAIRAFSVNHIEERGALIIACSALKESYRHLLEKEVPASVKWVFLSGSFELISKRMEVRKGHFMPPALLRSQFDALEIPSDAIQIDISKPIEEVVSYVISELTP